VGTSNAGSLSLRLRHLKLPAFVEHHEESQFVPKVKGSVFETVSDS